jgi:polyisoprenoid-binding protein YceI
MKLRTSILALSAMLFAALPAIAQNYTIDPAHSAINFSIKHMAISTVRGRFAIKSGSIAFDSKDAAKSSVTAVIDVTTVDTGVAQRDGHLKSPDFFDTAKFPTATFSSTSVKRAGTGYEVIGTLTLHGVSKTVTLHMDAPSKEQTGMDGKLHRGFSATTTLHRQDFGLTWNGPLKSGDNVLGDDVPMTFDIEAAQS